LPSETMIWQPEFTDKTLSRKPGAVQRVFRSLKNEWLPKGGYGDFIHAVRDINQWINGYYNVYRPHTNNDGLPPCLHEEKWKQVIPVS
ncbi:hypothetical protein OSL25_25860, partial [Escherichia coli]|nr:hypothetical protein [Escherichia coli]MDA6930524.1 hypothetical protein [Escherichia coli]